MDDPARGIEPGALTEPFGPAALREGAPNRDAAIRRLRSLLRRAATHQVHRIPDIRAGLGAVRVEELIEAVTDHATIDVLAKLDRFEGRSRFTTWVYKFGINHAASEARRAIWRDRPVPLEAIAEPASHHPLSPSAHAEARDLVGAVERAMRQVLTVHQRQVAVALLVDEIPIDVLAERMDTNRNALYKTLHDVRRKLRAELVHGGYLAPSERSEVKR